MTFHEWLNDLFGTEVDECDLDEESYAELKAIYNDAM